MRKTLLALALPMTLAACGMDEWFREKTRDHDHDEEKSRPAPRGIPVVDETHPGQMAGATPTCPSAAAPPATPSSTPTSAPSGDAKTQVRGFIQKLMDETRVVPDTAAKKGGPRGSPGSFAKLSPAQVDEFVAAIIYGADKFLPQSLKPDERYALVCAEISIESAFTPGTRGVNPGDASKVSVSPLQITVRGNPAGPGMWEDIFVQYANLPGLTHYDGSPWDTKSTNAQQLEQSIWDGIIASLWCITEQGRRGCPDWFGGPDGPCPKNMHTSFLAWVIGGPALKSGGDLAGQKDAYLASIGTDLKLLGYSEDLIGSSF